MGDIERIRSANPARPVAQAPAKVDPYLPRRGQRHQSETFEEPEDFVDLEQAAEDEVVHEEPRNIPGTAGLDVAA